MNALAVFNEPIAHFSENTLPTMAAYYPAWIDTVRKQIKDLECLPVDWDGYGGIPVSSPLADYTQNLLRQLDPTTPMPNVVPGSNGEILVDWNFPDIAIEVLFRAINDVHLVKEVKGGEPESKDLRVDFTTLMEWLAQLPRQADFVPKAAA